jgi:outer membrane protein assembly factor BamB
MEIIMKQIVISIAAGSILAAFALAQPTRPNYGMIVRGGLDSAVPYSAAHTDDDSPVSNRNPLVYVLTNNPQTGAAGFGAVHLGSGAFVQIGSTLPSDLGHALAPTRRGSLLSMSYSGKLYSIDPRTGVASIVGATGLGDCTTPASPCGPNSAVTLGLLDGRYYALDFSQNLYSLDPETGTTTLIGPTGIPQITFVPLSIDSSDGKLNVYDESLFSFRGKLYANFDTGQVDLSNGSETTVISAALYEIDPEAGLTRTVAPTDLGLLTIVNVNGTIYAFDSINDRFVILDVETGRTQALSNLDPSAGFVCGATPVPPGPSVRH